MNVCLYVCIHTETRTHRTTKMCPSSALCRQISMIASRTSSSRTSSSARWTESKHGMSTQHRMPESVVHGVVRICIRREREESKHQTLTQHACVHAHTQTQTHRHTYRHPHTHTHTHTCIERVYASNNQYRAFDAHALHIPMALCIFACIFHRRALDVVGVIARANKAVSLTGTFGALSLFPLE
jgi:hypothetical protein